MGKCPSLVTPRLFSLAVIRNKQNIRLTLRLTHIRKLGIATLFWFASLHSIFAQESKPCDWEKINEQVLVELNKVRKNPKSLIPHLESIIKNKSLT